MQVAFAFLEDRIAPVFDTAQRVLVAEVEAGSIRTETMAKMTAQDSLERAKALAGLGVEVLVCGAISFDLQQFLTSQHIRVIPFVAGDLQVIKAAWLQGRLDSGAFSMPGCHRRGWNAQRADGMNKPRHRKERSHAKDGESIQGKGCGSGKGRVPARQGRASSPEACLCPKCGHREPHEPGTPCHHKLCPECGTAMTREYPLF